MIKPRSLNRIRNRFLGAILLLFTSANSPTFSRCAHGDVIAQWTFPGDTQLVYGSSTGTSSSSPYAANVGTGTLVATRTIFSSGGSGAGIASVAGPGDTDPVPGVLQTSSSANTAYITLDFTFSTVGYENIFVSLDAQRFTFDPTTTMGGTFSVDGGATFVSGTGIGTGTLGSNWTKNSTDLSSFSVFNNQSSVLLRLRGRRLNRLYHQQRLDNITIEGTSASAASVPEPAGWLSASIGSLLIAGTRYRRTRQSRNGTRAPQSAP